ncbi:aminodeoxychorismate/anthranilate synthase component II [Aliiglaciecola sp. CAU 1673]|uniref:aminodeoxychorismate/anthranilate synthase component II n=1 Tax=Aliiglaciecola sp. CAU 1673 TaxID=3032595 RepID=UPI0023DBCE88|nr:aminodeoxychorismate/anthranilate synthase component II [Aliiglaciecola sp. CAU 1673]MDF2178778.1 aminodeoxychorismate/anthranilate synthase component II [Aliiglaciecola sp. CAU 1673]
MKKAHILLLDNIDSFTYNLVDEMRCLGYEMSVYRNHLSAEFILERMQQISGPVLLMLSPGPGAPSEAGCMPKLLSLIQGRYPVLGICLGHQAMVEHYGGKVGRADKVMHGKSSLVSHSGDMIFKDLPNPLPVARYHSLMATALPEGLSVLAQSQEDAVPMAVYHQRDAMLGFQFHPESILTAHGSQLLAQSIEFLLQQGVAL